MPWFLLSKFVNFLDVPHGTFAYIKKKPYFCSGMNIIDYIQRVFKRGAAILKTSGREVINPFEMS